MSLLAREYVAAFPAIDDTLPLSALITEAEDALTGLLEADNLVQVGRYRWDLWEGGGGGGQKCDECFACSCDGSC